MKRFLHAAAIPLVALSLSGCGPMLAAMGGAPASAPPQAPAAFQNISRSAIDFALNSFDAALYGVDAMMDMGKITPGSASAKSIAAAGRKIMAALGAADAARKLGNEASYDSAFADANAALSGFRSAIGAPPAGTTSMAHPPLTQADRLAILARADTRL